MTGKPLTLSLAMQQPLLLLNVTAVHAHQVPKRKQLSKSICSKRRKIKRQQTDIMA